MHGYGNNSYIHPNYKYNQEVRGKCVHMIIIHIYIIILSNQVNQGKGVYVYGNNSYIHDNSK